MAYSDIFNDHISNPRGVGEVTDANVVAEQTNPVCGDRLRLSLKVCDEVIDDAGFLAYGCAPTLACGSALVEYLNGMSVTAAALISRQELISLLGGLPARKSHAAALAIETLRTALELNRQRN